MTANTANMDVPSKPPSDISHISETQMPPIDTSKIKTEPREKLNVSCYIIVIDSDSNDSIVNLIPETSSSTEKPIPPPNGQSVPETPPLMMNKTMIQVIKFQNILLNCFRIEMSQSIIYIHHIHHMSYFRHFCW